jgi:hypothetical protein
LLASLARDELERQCTEDQLAFPRGARDSDLRALLIESVVTGPEARSSQLSCFYGPWSPPVHSSQLRFLRAACDEASMVLRDCRDDVVRPLALQEYDEIQANVLRATRALVEVVHSPAQRDAGDDNAAPVASASLFASLLAQRDAAIERRGAAGKNVQAWAAQVGLVERIPDLLDAASHRLTAAVADFVASAGRTFGLGAVPDDAAGAADTEEAFEELSAQAEELCALEGAVARCYERLSRASADASDMFGGRGPAGDRSSLSAVADALSQTTDSTFELRSRIWSADLQSVVARAVSVAVRLENSLAALVVDVRRLRARVADIAEQTEADETFPARQQSAMGARHELSEASAAATDAADLEKELSLRLMRLRRQISTPQSQSSIKSAEEELAQARASTRRLACRCLVAVAAAG